MPANPRPSQSQSAEILKSLFPLWGRHLKLAAPEPFCHLCAHIDLQHTSDLKSLRMEAPSLAALRLDLSEQGVFAPQGMVAPSVLGSTRVEEINPVWLEAHFVDKGVPLAWQVRWFTVREKRVVKMSASLGLGKVPVAYGMKMVYSPEGVPQLLAGFTRVPEGAQGYPAQWRDVRDLRVLRCWWPRQAPSGDAKTAPPQV